MTSVMTSGSGPSSRIEPASTNGVPDFTSVYISPLVTTPCSTAAAIEPQPRTTLIARRWCSCPPSLGTPSSSPTPSDVPYSALSMSCVATALPPNITVM